MQRMRRGDTIFFSAPPKIIATGTIAGPKESAGPAGRYVDRALNDDMFGEDTFERAERAMLRYAVERAAKNAHLAASDIDALFSGDLLNQIISASFAARELDVPFLGMYSACSTMTESMALAALAADCGYAKHAVAATGSHFASAERQYRFPLEQGTTRPPQSQWTATGAGACVISSEGEGVGIVSATIGRVTDYGVTDVNNMGAAMAPACARTLAAHFKDTDTCPDDYDLILSGDLGVLGSDILRDLCREKGYDISAKHADCGALIYPDAGREYQGGSGAGCCAIVFNSYVYALMRSARLKRVLFAATGALLSTVSSGQGESIPCISHAVELRSGQK